VNSTVSIVYICHSSVDTFILLNKQGLVPYDLTKLNSHFKLVFQNPHLRCNNIPQTNVKLGFHCIWGMCNCTAIFKIILVCLFSLKHNFIPSWPMIIVLLGY